MRGVKNLFWVPEYGLLWSRDVVYFIAKEKKKERGRRKYTRVHLRESNYLWQTACVSHHRERQESGADEEEREWEMRDDGERRRWRKNDWKGTRERRCCGRRGPACQVSLYLLIRLISGAVALPSAGKIQFLRPDIGTRLGVICRSRQKKLF